MGAQIHRLRAAVSNGISNARNSSRARHENGKGIMAETILITGAPGTREAPARISGRPRGINMPSETDVVVDCEASEQSKSREEYERSLIRRVQSGEATAFDPLVGPYLESIRGTVWAIVRNHHDAEDIVQQCMLRVFVKLDQFRGESQFSTWMTRIAINQSLMHLRKNRTVVVSIDAPTRSRDEAFTFEVPDPARSPEDTYSLHESKELLRKHIELLSPNLRSVVQMLYLNELSLKETATLLGSSRTAIKSRATRARKELKLRLRHASSCNECQQNKRAPYCRATDGGKTT